MRQLLADAGRSFLRAFIVNVPLWLAGVLAATDLNGAYAIGVAGLCASFAAGIRALQVFFPALTFSQLVGPVYGKYVDSFVRAFLGSLAVTIPGFLDAPDFGNWKAVGLAALTGALTAALRAVEAMFTPGEQTVPKTP